MSGNVTLILEGTFVILLLMWVLTHSTEFDTVLGSVGKVYGSGVGVLTPRVNGSPVAGGTR